MLDLTKIDKTWTLFIDRDGVINHEKKDDYIRNWEEFTFYDGVKEAMKKFSDLFGHIILVTNQRGVGKGLMSLNDLFDIHTKMMHEIVITGGRIDNIYFCTDLDNSSPNRKPNAGMAFQAKGDFPTIDFSKSIIAGNKLSDMQFGRNAKMYTAFIAQTHPETLFPHEFIDVRFETLKQMGDALPTKTH